MAVLVVLVYIVCTWIFWDYASENYAIKGYEKAKKKMHDTNKSNKKK